MTEKGTPGRASELAASKVEEIVQAAGEAAAQIRESAEAEARQIRGDAEAELERIREEAKRDGESELNEARKAAILYGQDARREAEALVGEAKKESDQIREQTRRAVEGRVVAAEKAAAEVLEEARALSGGLRQLGRSLEEQADRILRDVAAAHKRMQADLRIGPGDTTGPSPPPVDPRRPRERQPSSAGPPARPPATSVPSPPKRPNPFEELEVPNWVGRDQ